MAKYNSLVQLPRFESVNQAVNENYVRISMLHKVGGESNLKLAQLLYDCTEGMKVCNSLACKLCNRKFRITKVDEVVRNIRRVRGNWSLITIIDYAHAFPMCNLEIFDVQKAKDRLRKLLSRAGFQGPIIGSFEVDFHHECGLWLPHYHLISPRTKLNKDAEKILRTKLTKLYPFHIKAGRQVKAMKVQRLKHPFTQISYVYKLVSNSVHDYKNSKTGKKVTRKRRLDLVLFCRSLCWMHEIGRRKVLFSFGERGWLNQSPTFK